MNLRRTCYDKPWRCPGWAGGGWHYPSGTRTICDGGTLNINWDQPAWLREIRFHRCQKHCGTITLPHVTRWIDPTWIAWIIRKNGKDE